MIRVHPLSIAATLHHTQRTHTSPEAHRAIAAITADLIRRFSSTDNTFEIERFDSAVWEDDDT
ncbi:hypothetical protein [Streptomyces sp. NPDC005499]|uniref:hypothetical protein n=1 Tax=Streptomyces sp. NPDC005499 TaxID=3154883 RepID=UPI0033B17F6F